MDERLDAIFEGLQQKSITKQQIYRNTKQTFDRLKTISTELVKRISQRITPLDSSVMIEYRDINELEFHIKISGDLIIFIMHSNIITFPDDFEIMKSDYVNADFKRRFFGQFMAYNFMADSIKYNRLNDPGYLLGRVLINIDNHFMLEGVEQLHVEFQKMENNIVTDEAITLMVEGALIAAVNNDLMAEDIHDIQRITVKQKFDNQQVSRGQKVGFNFNYEAHHNE
jgi:hypothetical protein